MWRGITCFAGLSGDEPLSSLLLLLLLLLLLTRILVGHTAIARNADQPAAPVARSAHVARREETPAAKCAAIPGYFQCELAVSYDSGANSELGRIYGRNLV